MLGHLLTASSAGQLGKPSYCCLTQILTIDFIYNDDCNHCFPALSCLRRVSWILHSSVSRIGQSRWGNPVVKTSSASQLHKNTHALEINIKYGCLWLPLFDRRLSHIQRPDWSTKHGFLSLVSLYSIWTVNSDYDGTTTVGVHSHRHRCRKCPTWQGPLLGAWKAVELMPHKFALVLQVCAGSMLKCFGNS